LQEATTMVEIFEAHFMFTSNDRLRMLNHAIEKGEHKYAQPTIKTYMDNVIPERNIMGHQVLVPDGKPVAVIDGKGNQINLDQARELRRLILNLRQNFRDLLQTLSASS